MTANPEHGSSRVAIVSGGSRGLGHALVEGLLDHGYRVATYSRARTPALDRFAGSERFLWEPVDAGDPEAIHGFVRSAVSRWERIDAVINNAGIGADGILATMRVADVQQALAVNLSGAIYLIQSACKVMLRQRSGCIINISSVNAVRGHSGVAVYSATKAALDGLTRSLARELGGHHIRVNSVAPGYFESDMVVGLSEEAKSRIARRTPLGRLGTVQDIRELVLFLLSDRASFITGQTLVVDGGLTC
jgi:3-oxoacyl-[acyl-carrier protein] reductase